MAKIEVEKEESCLNPEQVKALEQITAITVGEAIESLRNALEDNDYEKGCRLERAIRLGIRMLSILGNRGL